MFYCCFFFLTLFVLDDLLQNPLVQSAIDMGFSLSEIRSTMEKKLQMSGESHTSVGDLVADLSAQKENTREDQPNEIPIEENELIQLRNLCVYFHISSLVYEIYLIVICKISSIYTSKGYNIEIIV